MKSASVVLSTSDVSSQLDVENAAPWTFIYVHPVEDNSECTRLRLAKDEARALAHALLDSIGEHAVVPGEKRYDGAWAYVAKMVEGKVVHYRGLHENGMHTNHFMRLDRWRTLPTEKL